MSCRGVPRPTGREHASDGQSCAAAAAAISTYGLGMATAVYGVVGVGGVVKRALGR
jgi:hypothetical protein